MATKKNLAVISKRIKYVRLGLGMNMTEFAEAIGLGTGRASVANWESGLNAPNPKRLKRISELGNVNVKYLLGETNETDIGIIAQQYTIQQREIMSAWESVQETLIKTGSKGDPAKLAKQLSMIRDFHKQIQELK